jgi:hypothetical protein
MLIDVKGRILGKGINLFNLSLGFLEFTTGFVKGKKVHFLW